MTIERSHGRARPTLPRSSDLTEPLTVGEPSDSRASDGRFAAGNQLATGRGWKHSIARSLGRDLAGEAGELGAEAYALYRAFLADLPCDCASVRSLVAQRARAAVLAARYARRAGEVGIDTADGATALDAAAKWDQRAERLAVTSLDVSTRLATAARARPVIDLGRLLEDAGRERAR
jgi:hypothetical protein